MTSLNRDRLAAAQPDGMDVEYFAGRVAEAINCLGSLVASAEQGRYSGQQLGHLIDIVAEEAAAASGGVTRLLCPDADRRR